MKTATTNTCFSHPFAGLSNIGPRLTLLAAAGLLLAMTMAMFGPVLFSSEAIVISEPHTDLFDQFAYWRQFGFDALRQGNLALWNPHVFSGVPFLAGFQSGLLYPLNAVYLILPIAKAINLSVAIHVFLIGFFMYLWTSYRGIHPLACLVSAVIVMFCAPHFMQIYAGHLPHLCTMTWAPLILLSIDGLLARRSLGWCLAGIFAVAMQILAGYPQHVFFTGVAASVYFALCFLKGDRQVTAAVGFFAIYAGACLLGAIQLLPGLQVAGESVRSHGAPYEFIARFSFPPENLLTLLTPDFFGNNKALAYWGRFYLWEMSFFVGIAGLVLAAYGVFRGPSSIRRYATAMSLFLIVLALGKYTPVFDLLYAWVPGFATFRGSSKFLFQASLFIAMLSGVGLDQMIRDKAVPLRTISVVFSVGLLLAGAAILLGHGANGGQPGEWWQQTLYRLYATGESYLSENHFKDPAFVQQAQMFASKSLAISATIFLFVALLLFFSRKSIKATYVVGLFAIAEIFLVAKASLPTFALASMSSPVVERVLAEHNGDYRVLNLVNGNVAMATGVGDIWGYDSVVLRRYAEFMTYTQGLPPEEATQYVSFSQYHRLFKMLRCRFAFIPTGGKIGIIDEKDVMPRLQLIQDYEVIQGRDDIFKKMGNETFDPREHIILETPPSIEPVISDEKGTVSIIEASTDHLNIEADLPNPAMLLITDVYSKGWHARPLSGSCQEKYEVMPANYILRAIPLSKGHHRIRVEYIPLSFQIGRGISLVAITSYIVLFGLWFKKRRKGLPRLSSPTAI